MKMHQKNTNVGVDFQITGFPLVTLVLCERGFRSSCAVSIQMNQQQKKVMSLLLLLFLLVLLVFCMYLTCLFCFDELCTGAAFFFKQHVCELWLHFFFPVF